MKSLEKTIFVFDVCSSTTIVEDLHRTGSIKRYNEMIEGINEFLKKKSESLPINIYKFIGDGFVLIISEEIEIEEVLKFAKELIEVCNRKISKIIEFLECEDIPRRGITIGLDKGIIHHFELNTNSEFIGRSITLACRLQSSQNKPEQVNSILMSVKVHSEIKDKDIKELCGKKERTFKNITGEKPIKCYELFPEKIDFLEKKDSKKDMYFDTIVVPAKEDGFKEVFLGKNCWYKIRISESMIKWIKYIAAYQSAPISAITHYAEVLSIEKYKNTGKYILYFKESAKKINPLKLIPKPKGKVKALQSPRYTNIKKLLKAKNLDGVF
jgi:hypothetical protein